MQPEILGENDEERKDLGLGRPFHLLDDLPRPPSQRQLQINPIVEIINHTPRVLENPLLGFWDYSKAAVVSILTLFLYLDNVSWDTRQQRLVTSPNALIAAFVIPWVTALELLEKRKLRQLRSSIARYLIDDAQGMGWIWFGAVLCSLPFGGTDYQTSNEQGALRWLEFILTVIGNTVINTIPMSIIIDHRVLLWPFLPLQRLQMRCCPRQKDRIILLEEKREKKYNELRTVLQATFEELPEKILAFSDEKILSYQTEVKHDEEIKDEENFTFLQSLFDAVNAEQPDEEEVVEQKGCRHSAARGLHAVRSWAAPYLEKSLPVLLGIVACGLGVTTQTDDVGNTIITGKQWSDDMEMEKAHLATPFQIMYSGLSLPLSFILTEYFCYEAGNMIGKGIATIINPKPSLDLSSRFYKKQKFVLTALTLYIGIFSTEANVDMIEQILDRDDVRQYYIDHVSDSLNTSWETARSFWLNCCSCGVAFFNSRSLLPLGDDIIKGWAMRFGGDLQKVAAHLIFFIEMLAKNFALIRGECLVAGLELLSAEERIKFLGDETAGRYLAIKTEIDRLTGEIAELRGDQVVVEHPAGDDYEDEEAGGDIDEREGELKRESSSRLQWDGFGSRVGSQGSINSDARDGLRSNGFSPVSSFSIETSPSGRHQIKTNKKSGLVESISQVFASLGSRNNSQNRSSRARQADQAVAGVDDPLLPRNSSRSQYQSLT